MLSDGLAAHSAYCHAELKPVFSIDKCLTVDMGS